MRTGALLLAVLAVLVLLASTSYADDAKAHLTLPKTTAAGRLGYVRRARVWEATDVSAKDLYNGPAGRLTFAVNEEVRCDFVPKPVSGWSTKFLCRLDDGTIVKVKYEQGGPYKEVFGEVLGTRLFWALGFFADRMLPVHVTCRGCPERPYDFVDARKKLPVDGNHMIASFPSRAHLGTYRFELATIEEPIDAETIEESEKQGWDWKLLDQVDDTEGGATRAEIDALKLLAAFVQDADNRATQNTLACPRAALVADDGGAVTCGSPIMFVADLGSGFGYGGVKAVASSRVNYAGWKARPVWRDSKSCRARLTSIGGIFNSTTLKEPVISEEGRVLLSEQLARLSDAQIADLFRAARVEKLPQHVDDGAHGLREVTIGDWVQLFKQKVSEITDHPACRLR